MPIGSFIQPGAFGPEMIAAMCEAYDAALKELQDAGQSVSPEVVAHELLQRRDLVSVIRLQEAALRERD